MTWLRSTRLLSHMARLPWVTSYNLARLSAHTVSVEYSTRTPSENTDQVTDLLTFHIRINIPCPLTMSRLVTIESAVLDYQGQLRNDMSLLTSYNHWKSSPGKIPDNIPACWMINKKIPPGIEKCVLTFEKRLADATSRDCSNMDRVISVWDGLQDASVIIRYTIFGLPWLAVETRCAIDPYHIMKIDRKCIVIVQG